MNRTVEYFSHDYDADTAIEYVNTGMYSMLNCSFTCEDPDYGTDTLHSDSANPPKPREQMAYEMAQEIKEYLDATEDGTHRICNAPYTSRYGEYSNSTLYAIEKALKDLAGDYNPIQTKWFMTIRNAGKMIAEKFLSGETKCFSYCESNQDEMNENTPDKYQGEGWYGIKRIPGFFDNSQDEFIIAAGYYGGGNCAFGYVYWGDIDTDEPANAVANAICESTGRTLDDIIFVEIEEDDKDE